MITSINKKTVIFILIVAAVLGIYLFFSKNIAQIISEKTVILPDITLAPTADVSTGASGKMLQEVLKKRPEYLIETKLRQQVPLKQDGFEITFDYSTNMFLVIIAQPTAQNEIRFQEWAKQQGLEDLSKFTISK